MIYTRSRIFIYLLLLCSVLLNFLFTMALDDSFGNFTFWFVMVQSVMEETGHVI